MARIARLNVMLSASTKGLSAGISTAQNKLDSLTASANRAQMSLRKTFSGATSGLITKGLAAMKGGVSSFASSAVANLKRVGIAAGAATVALAYLTKQQIDNVGDNVDFAKSVGLSYNGLRSLQFAAKLAGIESENLNKAFEKMTDVLGGAADGNSASLAALERIGLTFEQIQSLRPEQRFEAIANAINRIEDPAERLAAARDIFGKQGGALTNLFGGVGAAIEEAQKKLEAFGITLSAFDQSNIEKAGDALDTMGLALEGIANRLAAEVSPYIIQAQKDFEAWLESVGGIESVVDSAFEKLGMALDWILRKTDPIVVAWERLSKIWDSIPDIVKSGGATGWALRKFIGEDSDAVAQRRAEREAGGGTFGGAREWANRAQRNAAEEFDAAQRQAAIDDRENRRAARRQARIEGLGRIEGFQTPQSLNQFNQQTPGARRDMSTQGGEDVALLRQIAANTARNNLAYIG